MTQIDAPELMALYAEVFGGSTEAHPQTSAKIGPNSLFSAPSRLLSERAQTLAELTRPESGVLAGLSERLAQDDPEAAATCNRLRAALDMVQTRGLAPGLRPVETSDFVYPVV